jgi:hypothetical protein
MVAAAGKNGYLYGLSRDCRGRMEKYASIGSLTSNQSWRLVRHPTTRCPGMLPLHTLALDSDG